MMADIYQEDIKALAARCDADRCTEEMPDAAERTNPFCGDRVRLELSWSESRIAAVRHQVKGCLLCKAATAMLAELAKGCDRSELMRISCAIEQLLGGETVEAQPEIYQTLAVFAPVASYKSRHHCVLLPFRCLVA